MHRVMFSEFQLQIEQMVFNFTRICRRSFPDVCMRPMIAAKKDTQIMPRNYPGNFADPGAPLSPPTSHNHLNPHATAARLVLVRLLVRDAKPRTQGRKRAAMAKWPMLHRSQQTERGAFVEQQHTGVMKTKPTNKPVQMVEVELFDFAIRLYPRRASRIRSDSASVWGR